MMLHESRVVAKSSARRLYLSIALAIASALASGVASAERPSNSAPPRPSLSDRMKVNYQTRVVPAAVDINIRATNSMVRGVNPQTALGTAVAGHLASRIVERSLPHGAKDSGVKVAGAQPRTTPMTIAAAARANAYLAKTTPLKNAGMQLRSSPQGRTKEPQRTRSSLSRR
jgi:hypothetical protein